MLQGAHGLVYTLVEYSTVVHVHVSCPRTVANYTRQLDPTRPVSFVSDQSPGKDVAVSGSISAIIGMKSHLDKQSVLLLTVLSASTCVAVT